MTPTPPNPAHQPSKLSGFKPVRKGRIHLLCPQCGRKMSNVDRDKSDPKNAVLLEDICPECDGFGSPTYYDEKGIQIEN